MWTIACPKPNHTQATPQAPQAPHHEPPPKRQCTDSLPSPKPPHALRRARAAAAAATTDRGINPGRARPVLLLHGRGAGHAVAQGQEGITTGARPRHYVPPAASPSTPTILALSTRQDDGSTCQHLPAPYRRTYPAALPGLSTIWPCQRGSLTHMLPYPHTSSPRVRVNAPARRAQSVRESSSAPTSPHMLPFTPPVGLSGRPPRPNHLL